MQYGLKFSSNLFMVSFNIRDDTHKYFHDYLGIRDFHYCEKHKWEAHSGIDKYDEHSKFVGLANSNELIVGCRIIQDVVGLPIRNVLENCGLPVEQVPLGSREISRFGFSPDVINSHSKDMYMHQFATGILDFTRNESIETSFAVLRCGLGKQFKRIGASIEGLKQGTVLWHGNSKFSTVCFNFTKSHVPAYEYREAA